MGARTRADRGDQHAVVPRARLVDAVRSTPPGGTCLLRSQRGYGRRTLLGAVVGAADATITLPPRAVDDDEWRGLLDGALRGSRPTEVGDGPPSPEGSWLVVLDLDPDMHASLLPSLVELAAGCPAELRLALTCLDLGAAILPMSDRVVELRADDLALDRDESRALLRAHLPDLDESVAEEVVAFCDGWVAALLAAIRQRESHPEADLLTWLRTHGAERAWGPWLDRIPPTVYEMLLDTAILDQLHPGLVDAVCGAGAHALPTLASPGGALRLARTPLTAEGPWFDRHPLLTTALRYLAAGRPAETERHRRAADWYLAHGVLRDELAHRLLAGDAAEAVDRLHRHEDDLFERGLAHMALRWYQALPDNGLAPQDLLREGWANALSGRAGDARTSLDRLRVALRSSAAPHSSIHPEVEDLEAEADVLDAWLAEQDGDLPRLQALSSRACARFGEAWSKNSHQLAPLLEARAALYLGDLSLAQRILAAVRDEPFLSGAVGEGRRTATLAELAWARGEVVRARSWAARNERWQRDQGRDGMASQTLGGPVVGLLARAETGDPGPVIEGLAALVGEARSTVTGVTDEVLARLALATVLGTHRGPRAALEQLAVARDLVLERSPDGGLLAAVAAQEARQRLVAGDPRRAEQLLKGLPQSTARQLLLARAALQRRLPTAAASVRAIVASTPREEASHALLLAWAAVATSRSRAEQQLLLAADVCAEHGMTGLLVDVPEPLLSFARRTADYHVHEPLAGLVARAAQIRASTDGRLAVVSSPAGTGSLTRGDLQLLALLPNRATNARLAEQLGISVNTVKTRLRRLYAKLGAHDRDEAIARARAAGLMPAGADDRN